MVGLTEHAQTRGTRGPWARGRGPSAIVGSIPFTEADVDVINRLRSPSPELDSDWNQISLTDCSYAQYVRCHKRVRLARKEADEAEKKKKEETAQEAMAALVAGMAQAAGVAVGGGGAGGEGKGV